MTTTPNLLIDHIAANQAQKEVTANSAFDALDKALCQQTTIALSDANLTLTDAQVIGNLTLKFTGTLTAARTITIPAHAKLLIVENATTGGYSLSLSTPSGTATTLAYNERRLLYGDGSDLKTIATAGLSTPYDVGGSFSGKPTDSIVLLRYPLPRAVRFMAGMTGSQGVAVTAATAAASFVISKNGSQFASMTFAASAITATFSASTSTDFAAGDILTVIAPATADDTLANIGFALAGIRL
ncbi:MAG: hypothetical protein WC464_03775 [Bdellovibrionales bacterium]